MGTEDGKKAFLEQTARTIYTKHRGEHWEKHQGGICLTSSPIPSDISVCCYVHAEEFLQCAELGVLSWEETLNDKRYFCKNTPSLEVLSLNLSTDLIYLLETLLEHL